MTISKEIIKSIDEILVELKLPLSKEEIQQHNWNENSIEAMIYFFSNMKNDLITKSIKELKNEPAYYTVARGLDHWGVSSGPLYEKMLSISENVGIYLKGKDWWKK
jgi:hypothetical protein